MAEQQATPAPATNPAPEAAKAAVPAPANAQVAAPEGQAPGKAGAQAAATAAQQELDNAQQHKGETDQEYETRIARLTREARNARSEVERFKGQATAAAAEVTALKAELERARARKGITRQQFVSLSHKINEVGDDPSKISELFDEDEPDLPTAVKARIEKLEKALQQNEEQQQQVQAQEKYSNEINYVKGVMGELIESGECPLFDAFPKHAAVIRNAWYAQLRATGQQPDAHEVAVKVHEAIADDMATALQSERARSFLLKRMPELKALLGGQEVRPEPSPTSESQGNGRGNGPAANAQPLAEQKADTPPKKKTRFQLEEERKQKVRDAMAQHLREQAEG